MGIVFFRIIFLIFHVGIGMSILIGGELALSYLMFIVCCLFFISYFFHCLSFVIPFLSSVVYDSFFVTCCFSFFFSHQSKCISYPQTKNRFNNLNFGPVFIQTVFFLRHLSLVVCRLSFVVCCLMSDVWCLSSIICCLGSNCIGIQRLTIVASQQDTSDWLVY